jgi:hypothetical protein
METFMQAMPYLRRSVVRLSKRTPLNGNIYASRAISQTVSRQALKKDARQLRHLCKLCHISGGQSSGSQKGRPSMETFMQAMPYLRRLVVKLSKRTPSIETVMQAMPYLRRLVVKLSKRTPSMETFMQAMPYLRRAVVRLSKRTPLNGNIYASRAISQTGSRQLFTSEARIKSLGRSIRHGLSGCEKYFIPNRLTLVLFCELSFDEYFVFICISTEGGTVGAVEVVIPLETQFHLP